MLLGAYLPFRSYSIVQFIDFLKDSSPLFLRLSSEMAFLPRASATLSSQLLSTTVRRNAPAARFFHTSPLKAAIAHPITAHGPPPKAPAPAPELQQQEKQKQQEQEQQEQQRQQEEEEAKLAKTAKEDKVPPTRPSGLKRRFWRNVDVQKKQGSFRCCSGMGSTYFDMGIRADS